MNSFYRTLMSCLVFAFVSIPANAQENTSQDPVEISADQSLEWLQNQKQYVANGNVEVKQGDVTVRAEKIIADYKEGESDENGGTEIWQVTAQENVIIQNLDTTAIGDEGIYNLETGLATLTGSNLKLTTPEQTITAAKEMQYNTINGTAKAIGDAVITQAENTLRAPTITANFEKDQNGKEVLKTAKAEGGVTITTPDEVLTGSTATYNAKNNTATVIGNVKITRGPNVLEGARGEVNLTTNVSKMFGSEKKGGRVRAVFFPGSEGN